VSECAKGCACGVHSSTVTWQINRGCILTASGRLHEGPRGHVCCVGASTGCDFNPPFYELRGWKIRTRINRSGGRCACRWRNEPWLGWFDSQSGSRGSGVVFFSSLSTLSPCLSCWSSGLDWIHLAQTAASQFSPRLAGQKHTKWYSFSVEEEEQSMWGFVGKGLLQLFVSVSDPDLS
jgi:hypothetical protein